MHPPIPVFLIIAYYDRDLSSQGIGLQHVLECISTTLDKLGDLYSEKFEKYGNVYPTLTTTIFARHDESLFQKAVKKNA